MQGVHPVTPGVRCAGVNFSCDKGMKHPKITKLVNILQGILSVMCDPWPSAKGCVTCDCAPLSVHTVYQTQPGTYSKPLLSVSPDWCVLNS